ncbi:MAG: aspartate 1-decarboxylase [Bacteroidales bacterium]|nr:aspartate 1-decarboxylase [Bacteroidales bacterium]MBQ7213051.1 aspartate 1-decarboxylase [Bacteroidales bacterium]MBR3286531.1 aspartate 1-decarboxylase [Bacteroidales bacterium]MCR5714696.1 aspartate 1-decarboxylase [Bacteroidales bacterium]
MNVELLKSKIHRVTVTEANLNYMGSITIDEALTEAAGILPYERVSVVDINNGERFDTYVIIGKRDSGVICLNGPAARKVVVGDIVVIMAYASMPLEEARHFVPAQVYPDTATNRIIEKK